jgi:hypothetical protein
MQAMPELLPDDVREELEGLVEAWRDDAAAQRETAANSPLAFAVAEAKGMAAVYDECADELAAFLVPRQPAADSEPAGRQVMPKVGGVSFRCDCGCNVFTEYEALHYRCNSCRATFKGETAETAEPCTCDPGHICDGNRRHSMVGCPDSCPVHRSSHAGEA